MIGLTKSLARELAARNVTVNAIAPGYIQTAMTDNLPDEEKEKFLSLIPLKRLGTPLDIANSVLFLASPLADYITGKVLTVDPWQAITAHFDGSQVRGRSACNYYGTGYEIDGEALSGSAYTSLGTLY